MNLKDISFERVKFTAPYVYLSKKKQLPSCFAYDQQKIKKEIVIDKINISTQLIFLYFSLTHRIHV